MALTFPALTRIATHTPGDYGDAYFYQWLLRWDVHALLSSPLDVFDTNIFWPTQDTLVYSDTLLPVAPVAGALEAVFGRVVTFNLLYLGTWVGSLAAAYLLARRLIGDATASVLAAMIFTFSAVRLQHYVHFQLLFAGLIPLAVWLLLRFLDQRAWRDALGLGVVVGASVLITAYSALVIAAAMAAMVGGWLVFVRFRPGPRLVSGLLLAAAVAAAIAGPAVWKYRAYRDVLHRDYREAIAAKPGDLLAPALGSYLYGPLDRWATRTNRDGEHRLFPGLAAVALGGVGAVSLWRRRRGDHEDHAEPDRGPPAPPPDGLRRRELVLMLAGSAVLFVLAFGKYQRVAGLRIPLPFAVLTELGVPGLDSLRALGRFMVLPMLGLGLLAGYGFVRLTRSRPALRGVAGVVVGAFLALEYATPINMARRLDARRFTAVNAALRDLPSGPVVELPMADGRSPLSPYVEPPRMVWSTIDWHPRVNGSSAYAPAGYQTTVDLLNGLGDNPATRGAAMDRLGEFRVRYVVVRLAPLSSALNAPGITHYDEDRAGQVVDALRPLATAVTRHGDALLVQLG